MRVGILILALLLSGCATVDKAQLADGVTTWYAFSQGMPEANPFLSGLSGPEIIVVKLALTQVVKLTPDAVCVPATISLTVTGFGAALWNLAVVAGSGWVAVPVIAVLAWAYWKPWWQEAESVCADPWDGLEILTTSPVNYLFGDKE